MDFLIEVGKLIKEESKKAQASYLEQQTLLQQIDQAFIQKAPSITDTTLQAKAERMQSPQQRSQTRPQAVKKTVQQQKRQPAPPKKKVQATQPSVAAKASNEAVETITQPDKKTESRLRFTRGEIIKGIIVSEILGPPPSKRNRENTQIER